MRKCHFCAEEISDSAVVCNHCGRNLIPGRTTAIAATRTAAPPPASASYPTERGPNGTAKIFWVFSILAAVGGGGFGVLVVATATGAPQEAAGAAIGCLIAIAPYIIARGIQELTRG